MYCKISSLHQLKKRNTSSYQDEKKKRAKYFFKSNALCIYILVHKNMCKLKKNRLKQRLIELMQVDKVVLALKWFRRISIYLSILWIKSVKLPYKYMPVWKLYKKSQMRYKRFYCVDSTSFLDSSDGRAIAL